MARGRFVATVSILAALIAAGCSESPTPKVEKAFEPYDLEARRQSVTSFTVTNKFLGSSDKYSVELYGYTPVKLRVEPKQGAGWIIKDYVSQYQIAYNKATKMASKTLLVKPDGPLSDDAGAASTPRIPDLSNLADAKVSTVKIDGVECWRVDMKKPDGGKESYWLDKEYGLLRRKQAGVMSISYSYSEINAVPYSRFEVPEGIKVMDMTKPLDLPKVEVFTITPGGKPEKKILERGE